MPTVTVPEEWKVHPTDSPKASFEDYFWEIFNDESLNDLETEAVANNPNLYMAMERILQARAEAGVSRADLFPQLNLDPSYSATGASVKVNGFKFPAALGLRPIKRVNAMQYFFPIYMNYELDIWGKLRGTYESAFLNAEAEEAAYCTALLSLTTELASDYFNLRSLDSQIELLEKTISARQKDVNLTTSRFDKGLISYIDVSNAQLQLANVQSELQETMRQRQLFENAIATLMGMPSSLLCVPFKPLVDEPPVVPSGIPSEILFQRPDIAEAERRMASEHALIGPAYASFFPALTLTGTIGAFGAGSLSLIGSDFKEFLRFRSQYLTIGANAAQVLFDGGRNLSNVEVAWSRFLESTGAYQQQVLTAFEEVEEALVNIEQQGKQYGYLSQAVEAATTTTRLATNRYLKGISNYLEVVDSERSQLEAERNAINILGQRYISTIQLIKALGGCF